MYNYNKRELVEILTGIIETGIIPALSLNSISPNSDRGRPSFEVAEHKQVALISALTRLYPRPVDIKSLGRECGMLPSTVSNLKTDEMFLAQLEPKYSQYFRSIKHQARLSPLWRAVLDLHFYNVLIEEEGYHIPLYGLHAIIWNSNPKLMIAAQLKKYNANQKRRVFNDNFLDKIKQKGWKIPANPYKELPSGYSTSCELGCEVSKAWLAKADVRQVSVARKILEYDIPILGELYINTKKDIVSQILGLV